MSLFHFEMDFADSLRCIPMVVRHKLDTCGVKLKLHQWQRFTPEQRQHLVDLPSQTDPELSFYRQTLEAWIQLATGETASRVEVDPHPPWLDLGTIPPELTAGVVQLGSSLTLTQWANLTTLQRFSLIKLSRSSHEHRNLRLALQEFDVIKGKRP